jgi:hypothetical protein
MPPQGLPGAFTREQLEQMQRAFEQGFPQARRPDLNGGAIQWGGVRLGKVDAALQDQLGLPENEGLLVNAVDAKSPGDKAGLRPRDVLVKLNNNAVPNTLAGFAKLLKDQKADDPMDLVVVRNGKEETIKAARLPAAVQDAGGDRAGMPGFPGAPGFAFPRVEFPRVEFPRADFNPRLPINPFGKIDNLQIEMTVNGAKFARKQKGDDFSGEYSKEGLKITVAGKIENGAARVNDIVILQGKDEKKFTNLRDVPPQYRMLIQQLMPSPVTNLMFVPLIPDLQMQNFPGVPLFPGRDN